MRTPLFVLVLATCTMAIQRRSHGRYDLRVVVKPKFHRMRDDDQIIKVRCKVKSLIGNQIPELSFFTRWQKNYWVPLSSGNPGIKISPVHTQRHRTVVHELRIDTSQYKFLHYGKNEFYCLGTLDRFHSQRNEFVILKEYQYGYRLWYP